MESFDLLKPKCLYTIAPYIDAMATTIQVSSKLLKELKKKKMYVKESYEEIIWDLLEDTMELSEEAKRNIKKAEKDIAAGRVCTLAQIKKKMGMKDV